MGLSLLDAFVIAACAYTTSRIVSFFIASNEASIQSRKERDRLKTLARLYGRDD